MRRLSLMICLPLLAAGDWRQFRGNDSRAVAAGAAPTEFGKDGTNVAWKAELPGRGLSGPVVFAGRVFLTACSEDNRDLFVLAFDGKTGKRLWKRDFRATGPTSCHPKTCMAAPTPAGDGERVVALFGTNDLVCLDVDGNLLWARSLYGENPGATDGRGLASSPLVVGDTAVVHVENQNNSFAAGINLKTGADRWKVVRPRKLNWSSPVALPGGLVLLQGTTEQTAVDAKTGSTAWELEGAGHGIASSVVAGGVLYLPGSRGLAAYRLRGGRGPKKLWQELRLTPATASPVVLGGKVYALRGPILARGDAATGKPEGRLRLKGQYSATPVAAGGVLYAFNEAGVCQVVRPGADGEDEVAGTGDLGETILCTPAVVNGAMYVRSDQHLWKIAG